ncbi:hypothetical protein LSAT2_002571 [Lamellibrachia satsuma]|nr:hypothetical protein LSAT2_002571 [Lamellibrachia satsuma]
MAPLDWHRLMQMQVNDLAEDETRAEDLYDVLGEFELGVEGDVERLKKLFEVTQAVMLLKGTQAMIAEEELDKTAAQQGKSTAKRGIIVTIILPLIQGF